MKRRGILAGLLLLAVVCTLASLTWPWDSMEAARRRVRLGIDEAAVTTAVGREPDDSFGRLDMSG
jgi:hypothetical protein